MKGCTVYFFSKYNKAEIWLIKLSLVTWWLCLHSNYATRSSRFIKYFTSNSTFQLQFLYFCLQTLRICWKLKLIEQSKTRFSVFANVCIVLSLQWIKLNVNTFDALLKCHVWKIKWKIWSQVCDKVWWSLYITAA